jgi:hypothetical protein
MKLPTSFKRMPVVWLSLANQIIIIGRSDLHSQIALSPEHEIPRRLRQMTNGLPNHALLDETFHVLLSLSIPVTIFLLNTFVYKRLQASGRSFPISTRIVIGMVSAALSMCMAGTVEIFRQNVCKTQNFTQIIGTNVVFSSCFFKIQYPFLSSGQRICRGEHERIFSISSICWYRPFGSVHLGSQSRIRLPCCSAVSTIADYEPSILLCWPVVVFRLGYSWSIFN